ncbi:MAG TPA: 3-deoxy-D-manno-octulosonic acid transferase [Sedimentisphaerales bacterium]|jgi:3-deoxy-D-manno-octulosonic-acid transferase|nr:3-deoxy-D-manno-octulosonic acid transferase [Sedimentisphaerales bacterium]HNU28070.1 3-deoxy-D-manno-octulosonic acid transferase [Sedimentisphaerales bacterium]
MPKALGPTPSLRSRQQGRRDLVEGFSMRLLLDVVYFLAALAVSPILVYRVIRHGRYRTGWAQRFGKASRKEPGKKCIWLHAVSMGEVNAAKTLVAEIEKQFPDCEIVVSTTTDTGYAQADKLFGRKWSVFFFPFDISWIIRRAFNRLEPSICLLMELEVWPNFLFSAHRRRVPVVVLNGRISDRSFSRYRRIRCVTRTFFGRIDRVLAQTEQYAERFRDLGCPAERVLVTSSLKYDTAQVADHVEGAQALAEQLNLGAARLWVAGGTGNDEEKIILDVYKSLIQEPAFRDLRLAVVPRKPERFDEVAALIEQMGFPMIHYSRLKGTSARAPADGKAVILGDTMGDLRKFYSLAEIIFVGRTLVPMGGSDMMEAAALGKCTLFGPHTFNFRQTVEVLLQGHGAIEVKDSDDLLATMKKCLSDRAHAQAVARAGQQIIRENQGATAKTMEVLQTLLFQI